MKWLRLMMILFLTTILAGCTKENLEDCPTVYYLTFEYSKNKQGVDLFPNQVSSLDVYAFDLNGKFIGLFSDVGLHLGSGTYAMPIDLPPGEYTFVVWGGAINDYGVSDITNWGEGLLVPHTSHIKDARLFLFPHTDIIRHYPEDLFFGIARNIYLGSDRDQHLHIRLTKNTHMIHVTVNGFQYIEQNVDYDHFDMVCNIANGGYRFDNSVSNPGELISYMPDSRAVNGDSLRFDIKTLRLLTDMKSQLILKNKLTNTILFDENLIELLLQLPAIKNDDDLDMNDAYNILITIDVNLSIHVTINGYIVNNKEQEI